MNKREINNILIKSDIKYKSINNLVNSKESELLKLFCIDINKINEKDECNWTPLYRSVISGNLKITEVLLNNGADPNIQCSMGETPLYQAVDMEKLDHVKLLLKHGADPNIPQIDGLSCLHSAVLKQNIIIIKYLLKFKANPNKQSSLYKQTPVHLAIKNNVDSMILLILANSGGSLTIRDKFSKKPIDYINGDEMRKTIELLKLEKNNENLTLKKICFTPSKNNKLEISNVISKTIKSVSPKKNGLKNGNNIITLKDSGKSKFNFLEIKTSNKKQENYNKCDNNIDSINDDLKINLFNIKNPETNITYYDNKGDKLIYKNEKFEKRNNKYLNKSNYNIYKIIESPIQEESSSIISSNKYFKNPNVNVSNNNYKNKINSSFSKSDIKSETKNTNINSKSKNILKTDTQKKYIRKKSSDKIISFKCRSNKKTNNKLKRNNTEEIKSKKTLNNKNILNSRNNNNIFLVELNKNGNLSNANSISNSITDKITNYKTQLSTNSNKILTDNNSTNNRITEDKSFINKKVYNKPKVITNSYIKQQNEKNIIENNLLIRNKNKNWFNKKNKTSRNCLNNKLFSLMNKEQKLYNFLNNEDIDNNKENISINIKKSIFSASSSRNTYNGKKFNKNSNNSSQSLCTYYTYTKNENNSLLEVVEKTKNIIYKKESFPIYKWLQEIDLLVYLPLFIKKKIYSFEKIITDLKLKKIIITPNNIRKIGIEIPGHIYRIIIKLELDAELIDKKIFEYLLYLKKEEENNINNGKPQNEESTQSLYDCCGVGCCSLKKSHIRIKIDKNDLGENKIFMHLEKWLKNINMVKYKENFEKNGFDKIEFLILQMFSSLPLEEKTFEKEIRINNNNDIDLLILQLNKDIKIISNKFKKKKRSSSMEVDKNSISKYLLNKDNNSKKTLTRTSSNVCSIF